MLALEAWAVRNKMEINAKKTKEMWISFWKSHELQALEPIRIRNSEIERVKVFKLLGVHVQSDLKWITHIHEIVARVSKQLHFLGVSLCRKTNLPTEVGLTTYITKIRPLMEYALPIWGGIPNYLAKDIQRIQDRSMDLLGLARETLEPLSVKRDKQTGKAFKDILESADRPCRRFIKEV